MESAKTYILSELTKIVKNIPKLKIEYKYDAITHEHLIKIFPLNEYNNNKLYKIAEENLLFDFIEKYPSEGIVFFSEKEWIDIKNPDEIFEGIEYFNEDEFIFLAIQDTFNFEHNDLFNFNKIQDDFIIISDILGEESLIKTLQVNLINLPCMLENKLKDNINFISLEFSGENNYALAA